MKKILILLLSMASFAAYAQGPNSFGGVALRVNDTTTYQTNAAAFHTAGYYDIYFNNQATNDHWDVWNGSSYDHIFAFGSGSVSDGDKGDITVSSSGTVWNIDAGVVGATELATAVNVVGKQDLFITGPAMWATVTNGAVPAAAFEVGGKTYQALAFSTSVDTNAQFQFSLPRNWNNGTITVTAYWTATSSGSGTVQFEVSAVALSNDDPFSTSFGSAVVIDDTLLALDDVHVTPTSSALTIGGSPADGDLVMINILRDVSDDTLSANALLLGVRVTITLDAATSE